MKTRMQVLFALLCLLCCNTVLLAQEKRTVAGVVKDPRGAALASATIRETGTSNKTTSDANGAFSLKVKPGATIVISYVGYDDFTLKTGSGSSYTVTLQDKIGSVQDVVVTSLGVSKGKKALGYAQTTIKAEQLTETGTPNFATALYGKAPGVRIGATPGGATSSVNITIRGINSITGKTQPLIVLDGVPIRNGEANNSNYWGDQRLRGNGLLDINPEDIDNISILKGASAAALYGSEAVNGVVLVTTKSASKGKKGLGVDVNMNYSADDIAYLPRYQNVRGPGISKNVVDLGQSDDGFLYQDYNGSGVKDTRGVLGSSINFGPKFDGKPTLAWDGKIRPYVAQINNYAGLFRTANSSSVNVAISKASENASMRFSLTRQDNQGISLGADNTKNIAVFNGSFRLHPKFSTDLMVNYINQHTHNRPYSIDRLTNNFGGMMGRFDNADWYLAKYKTSKGYRYVTGRNTQSLTPAENIIWPGLRGDIMDYVWRVKEYNEDEYSNRVIASMTNNWQIIDDLRLRTRVSNDFTSMRTETKQSTEIPLAFGNSGYFGLNDYQNSLVYGEALLTYTKKLTSDLDLTAMGGYNASKEITTTISRGTNGGLSTENFFDISASVNLPSSGSSRFSIVKDAFLGTLNANYKGYLFVEGTVRRDRTSTMHPNKNSFVYPSANASFIFTEAFKMPDFINYGKLRASWGIVGNYPDAYLANIAYNQNTLGVQAVGGQPVLYTTIPSSFGNDGIKPEQKREFEIGIEASFLKKRIELEASYYNAQIVDQILPLTLPATTGATSILTNIGTLRNTGIEVAVRGIPVQTKQFKWEVGVNLAKNNGKVEKLAPGLTRMLHADYDGNAAQLISDVGRPMGDFYAHPVATDDKGNMIVDPNGMYKVDPNKMVRIGNAMPKLTGGITNTLSFKGFIVDATVDFRVGGYVMPTALNWMTSRGLTEESLNYMDKEHGGLSYYQKASGERVLTSAAQGPNGEKVYNDGIVLAGIKADGSKNDYIASASDYYWTVYNWGGPQYSPNTRYELYIKENSYVKFREITIGYRIPDHLARKIGAQRLQFSVFGRNLFYLYRTLKDMDAEQTTAGSRWFQTLNNIGTNPSTKTFGVMLRATF
ncbi:TonB-linked outer membrane protein, SusC/RagA family [Hydrobacter penzbergensis]|uniref:TonB-linked outer membrane protein, SusC/RagA family n=1 Tax=Hydrobacter penzbergensis TaxID=1235997 RepID=A0A8X8LF38_9BACT|nr:SusC/RagA family TonB-linked outer membrane protein [Hydrobacter penzbergensis]SDX25701.1 TonB-linked outer membrane protein, SusC/RagA family [Hydrobacter penzbergensis]